MSGNCMWVSDCYDGPSVSKSYLRRAAKPHKCCECGETIKVGALHEYVTGKWDGDWSSFRTCARCVNIWEDYGDGRVYGGLTETFQETFGFDYRNGIPKDFAPCHERTKPRELGPPSETVPM